MPRYEGVYRDATGRWYFKVWLGRDPLTGKQRAATKRGFATAADAARARRAYADAVDGGTRAVAPGALTVGQLLDEYLDGLDADRQLSIKTRHSYRHHTVDHPDSYPPTPDEQIARSPHDLAGIPSYKFAYPGPWRILPDEIDQTLDLIGSHIVIAPPETQLLLAYLRLATRYGGATHGPVPDP